MKKDNEAETPSVVYVKSRYKPSGLRAASTELFLLKSGNRIIAGINLVMIPIILISTFILSWFSIKVEFLSFFENVKPRIAYTTTNLYDIGKLCKELTMGKFGNDFCLTAIAIIVANILIVVLLAVNAIKLFKDIKVNLYIPYLAGAVVSIICIVGAIIKNASIQKDLFGEVINPSFLSASVAPWFQLAVCLLFAFFTYYIKKKAEA